MKSLVYKLNISFNTLTVVQLEAKLAVPGGRIIWVSKDIPSRASHDCSGAVLN